MCGLSFMLSKSLFRNRVRHDGWRQLATTPVCSIAIQDIYLPFPSAKEIARLDCPKSEAPVGTPVASAKSHPRRIFMRDSHRQPVTPFHSAIRRATALAALATIALAGM